MGSPNYEPLFHWVKTREAARIAKEKAPDVLPYTTDPIISKYRFCNVRREDDRVTVWIRKNIREPFADHPYLWLMLCIGRQINWPETLHDLITIHPCAWPETLGEFIPEALTIALNHRKNVEKKKLYTGAYMISAPSEKGADKQKYIAETVIGALWRDREKFATFFKRAGNFLPTVRETHELLSQHLGWGPFMAYQAVGDMLFTRYLTHASDKEQWCAAGPGTIRGLNRIHGRAVDFPLRQPEARTEIRATWKVIREETGVEMAFNDVPNCYCETDKYLRVKNGEGTPRALYVPGRGS